MSMDFQRHYYKEDAKQFVAIFESVLKEEPNVESPPTEELSPKFISRLCDFLEKSFPSYGNFDTAIGNELRKFMQGDNQQVKAIKKKIHSAINKAKEKYLDTVQNKCEKLQVVPKMPKEEAPVPKQSTGENKPYVPNEL